AYDEKPIAVSMPEVLDQARTQLAHVGLGFSRDDGPSEVLVSRRGLGRGWERGEEEREGDGERYEQLTTHGTFWRMRSWCGRTHVWMDGRAKAFASLISTGNKQLRRLPVRSKPLLRSSR